MAVGDVGGKVSWRDAADAAALVDLAAAPDARVAAAALAALDAARLRLVSAEPEQ